MKSKQFYIGFIICLLTVIFWIYWKSTQGEVSDIEPLCNRWTILHFSGCIGFYFLTGSIKETKRIPIIIVLILIVAVEAYEYHDTPDYWIRNIGNNSVDVIAGKLDNLVPPSDAVYKHAKQHYVIDHPDSTHFGTSGANDGMNKVFVDLLKKPEKKYKDKYRKAA